VGHRFSVARILQLDNGGLPGYRAVLFGRAAVDHPAGPPSARPSASGAAAFRVSEPLSIRDEYFEAAFLRPTRSPDYASTAPSRARLQAWLPACWLHFGWVGFAPTGRLLRVSVCHPQTSSPTGIAWSLPENSLHSEESAPFLPGGNQLISCLLALPWLLKGDPSQPD